MKHLIALFTIMLLSSCSTPKKRLEVNHMKNSMAIESILEKIEFLHYDESFSELDRDKEKLKYAEAFYHEVFNLATMLKKSPDTLPNHKPVAKEQRDSYIRIISLLENNLNYLQKVINHQKTAMILPAIKSTKQSCIQCHLQFKSKP